MLNLEKLLTDVFEPQADETVTVVIDLPHGKVKDNTRWKDRRRMAERWRSVLARLGDRRGFRVNPILRFRATGANNADLPGKGSFGKQQVDLAEALLESTLVIAMTEFSATAPLAVLSERKEDFRAASMPGVEKRMEKTALAADYALVARRCHAILHAMEGAVFCDVVFSTGHRCRFDLRFREAEVDDGSLPRFKEGSRIINLPSGETFMVPYEGEIRGIPSWTAGVIPVMRGKETVLFHVTGNRVTSVEGGGKGAGEFRRRFEDDPACANIAEVAFGVNEGAEVTGNVLEDEKAGFHWAFGRSDHLGGSVGVEAFKSPDHVIHQDIVYATGNPVQVTRAELVHPDGRRIAVILGGQYQI